jgi:hypothetical protein
VKEQEFRKAKGGRQKARKQKAKAVINLMKS